MPQKKSARAKAKRIKISPEDSPSFEEKSPESTFESLIAPLTVSDFLKNHWEKEPVVIESTPGKASILSWFSKATALELLSQEKLLYLQDLHFCICQDGVTKDLNDIGKVTKKEFARLTEKDQATVQFHQPQRFLTSLWRIVERLECFFGCLVGTNVYITPRGTQGLAPHYDDVEVFIFQLEGEKHWRLYKAPVPLAQEYKTNLPMDLIGKPTHEFVLKAGDVLYMPRGTVHQADTPQDTAFAHSTHITISTYQRHSVGDYLLDVFPSLVERGQQLCLELRKGLPLRSLVKDTNRSDLLRQALESLLGSVSTLEGPAAVARPLPMARSMLEDFMNHRLPPPEPHPDGQENSESTREPIGPQPGMASRIRFTHPEHVAFILDTCRDSQNEDSDEDENNSEQVSPLEDGSALFVYSSVHNSRRNHMVTTESETEDNSSTDSEATVLKFPPGFLTALQQLENSREGLGVASLSLPSDEDRLQLAISLWSENLIAVDNSKFKNPNHFSK